jgi:hypothetical protein
MHLQNPRRLFGIFFLVVLSVLCAAQHRGHVPRLNNPTSGKVKSPNLPNAFQPRSGSDQAAPVGGAATADYFPLSPGNTWLYRYTNGDPYFGFWHNYRVLDSIHLNSRLYWQENAFRPGAGALPVVDTVRIDTNGVLYWSRLGIEDILYKSNCAPGDTWSFPNPVRYGWERRVVTYVGELDTLHLPEGPLAQRTFANVKVYTSDVPGYFDFWEDSYLAPGIGRIFIGLPQLYAVLYGAVINAVLLGDTTVLAVRENGQVIGDFRLYQNYPNPFNPSTTINYDLPVASNVSLVVYDLLGRRVVELASGQYEAGYHSVTWNVPQSGIASGVYFAHFTVSNARGNSLYSKVNKLILLK